MLIENMATRAKYVLIAFFLSGMALLSCNKLDYIDRISPSQQEIHFTGAGGEVILDCGTDYWEIPKVLYPGGGVEYYGTVSDLSGKVMAENVALKLTGDGILQFDGYYYGFTLERNASKLKVKMDENLEMEDRGFIVVLENDYQTQTIEVTQAAPSPYSVESVEWEYVEGSYVKEDVVTQEITKNNQGGEGMPYSIKPFAGCYDDVNVSIDDKSQYKMFVYHNVSLAVPVDISFDGSDKPRFVYDGQDVIFKVGITRSNYGMNTPNESIVFPTGEHTASVIVTYASFDLKYVMRLSTPDSKELKVVTGVIGRSCPTGDWDVVWDKRG